MNHVIMKVMSTAMGNGWKRSKHNVSNEGAILKMNVQSCLQYNVTLCHHLKVEAIVTIIHTYLDPPPPQALHPLTHSVPILYCTMHSSPTDYMVQSVSCTRAILYPAALDTASITPIKAAQYLHIHTA